MTNPIQMNPFLADTSITILVKKTITTNSREIEDGVNKIHESRTTYDYIDVQEFTKSYKSIGNLKVISELKPIACKLFLYIQQKLERDQDFIDLPREILSKALGISNASVGLAVTELKNRCIITRKGLTDYWINPKYIFCGNRKAFYYKNAPNKVKEIDDKNATVFNYGEVSSNTVLV